MSHWNYRITYESQHLYGLREVHYDDSGEVVAWTNLATFSGDIPEEITEALRRAMQACERPVLNLDTRQEGDGSLS